MSLTKQDNTKQILKSMDDERYDEVLKELESIPSFAASENVVLTDEQRAVMTKEASGAMMKFFDILKLDYKTDPNLLDTPFRVASMYANELMVGRYVAPPRIEAFPGKVGPEVKFQEEFEALLNQVDEDFSKKNIKKINKLFKKYLKKIPVSGVRVEDVLGEPGTIVVKKADVNSLCSHHLIPFVSTNDDNSYALIAYVPNPDMDKNLLGISKVQRVMDWFGRRPQLQEHLNWQVHAYFCIILQSLDVMVSFNNIVHYCEKTRGVESNCGSTSTVRYSGVFTKYEARQEIQQLGK